MMEVRASRWASLERFQPAVTEISVYTYDEDDDVQWWHVFVGVGCRGRWDEIQVLVFAVTMAVMFFLSAVVIWILIT